MSELDDLLNSSHDEVDAIMGTKSIVCNGETFNVVWNDYRLSVDGESGGLEPNIQATATAQPSDVSAPAAMKGKRCTVGGTAFRVLDVSIGDVAVTFTLCDVSESR